MRKRIISLFSALIMTVSMAAPAFAYTSVIYSDFKNAPHSELRSLFIGNFSEFDISQDGRTYDDSTKSLIILEARQRGFSSFEELNQVITQVADEIFEKRANPNLLGLSGMSNVNLTFDSPRETDPANMFSIGGQDFIVIDKVTEDGEDMFFVMAKNYFGTIAVDPDNLGRWSDNNSRLTPYKLTNSMAFGNYTTNLPEEVLVHMDMLHEWNVEPGSGAGFQQETVLIAPISCISATEYKKYGEKIGLDRTSGLYWTRTPVLGDSLSHFTVNTASPRTFGKNKGWGGNQLRPVFYLKSSFFKEEKMERCGENVTAYLEDVLTLNDINRVYSSNEIKDVFGSLSVTPQEVVGNAVVGETLSTDYTYDGIYPLLSVDITWERSSDKTTWTQIQGASGKSYQITNDDAGCFIRAAFTPTFDSIILKNGSVTYSEKADAVFTDAGILEAVAKINAAQDTATVRSLLNEYNPLLHLDASVTAFPENAVEIFIADEVKSVSDVVRLYNQAIALDQFANASGESVKEKAESQYLMGSVAEYAKLTQEQKDSVIYELYNLGNEKKKVSEFIAKAKQLIMLTRFNNVEREVVPSLVKEYAGLLGVDISGLTAYQLELVAPYVAGINYGTDLAKLVAAVKEGVAKAKNTYVPSAPVEGNTQGGVYDGGFTLPSNDKPRPSGSGEENLFNDLDSVPWSIAAINSLAKKGILSGKGDGIFAPMDPVTRNEFVKMIVSAFNVALEGEDVSFEDIEPGSWSEKYIKAAVNAGIISGVDENHFGNGMNIVRQDVAVISDRLMTYKEIELRSSSLRFEDSGEISEYALMSVAKMCYNGIMSGVDEKTFAPKGTTTRAQAAVVVYNLLNYYNDQLGTDDEEEEGNNLAMRTTGDKYDLVFNLGILKEEFGNDPIITRGELAAALAVFGKYDCFKAEGIFGDVKASHQYASEIESVYRNNLMAVKTANTFMPDEPATYGEAYNAIIAASGYANFTGGTSEIESILRKEPVYAQKSDELTIDMAKKIFYAALSIPVFTMGDPHSVVKIDKTFLNEKFNVYKEKGILNVVAGMSLGGRAEMPDDKLVITVDGQDYLYYADSNYDYSAYLGFEVTYYYEETDEGFRLISMMIADSDNEPLKLSYRDIISAEQNLSAITYDKGTRTKRVKISRNADFIYNGKRSYSITAHDLAPDNGYITLIDTNQDEEYDVVKIEKYEYIMVAQVDARGKTILDRFTWQTYSFDEEKDADKINITKNGRYIKMDYLVSGDILAIARSRDGSLINAYVSDSKVSGKVMNIMDDEYAIELDGNILQCVKNFNFAGLTNSINITVGLDWNGYAVGYYTELVGVESKIGYLYKLYAEDDETIVFNILTQDNKFETYRTAKKVIANGLRARKADIYSLFSYNEANKTMTTQLIAYDLDQDGNINRIYTSYTDNGIQTTQTTPLVLNKKYIGNAPMVVYNSFGMTFDFEYNMLKAGVMFDITMENGKIDKDRSYVTNVGAQTIPQSSSPERLFIYNSDISKISNLCVYEHSPKGGNEGYNESFNTQAFLVNKVSTMYDEKKDQVVTVYRGYHNGNAVSYTFSEKLLEEVDPSKIKAGDVLLVWLSGTEINRFRRLFALEEANAFAGEADLLCNYGDHNYDGSSIVRGGTNWDYAYDWAQHIIERAEGKSGSTVAAATRWASLYGTIELVFKSELYTYPVLKLKVAGKSESQAYTLDSNTKVYVYSKSEKTVRVLDGDSMNYSMRKAVVTARYGNVRDVIIYEE